jgi:hypothetical protein
MLAQAPADSVNERVEIQEKLLYAYAYTHGSKECVAFTYFIVAEGCGACLFGLLRPIVKNPEYSPIHSCFSSPGHSFGARRLERNGGAFSPRPVRAG